LLYTLLVVSAVLTTTLVVSNFIRSSIKEAGIISDVTEAYYTGESGVEKSLHSIRKFDKLPVTGDCGLANLKCEINIAESTVSEVKLDLPKDQTFQFDLTKLANKFGAGVESLGLAWEGVITKLEISTVELSSAGVIKSPDAGTTTVNKSLWGSGAASVNNFVGSKNYRVRIKALYGDANNLKLTLHSLDNQQGSRINFSNFLKITGTGISGEANQMVSVDMNRYAPTQGLFDYVLFSEEKIEK